MTDTRFFQLKRELITATKENEHVHVLDHEDESSLILTCGNQTVTTCDNNGRKCIWIPRDPENAKSVELFDTLDKVDKLKKTS